LLSAVLAAAVVDILNWSLVLIECGLGLARPTN
jgi:hypothetical protein